MAPFRTRIGSAAQFEVSKEVEATTGEEATKVKDSEVLKSEPTLPTEQQATEQGKFTLPNLLRHNATPLMHGSLYWCQQSFGVIFAANTTCNATVDTVIFRVDAQSQYLDRRSLGAFSVVNFWADNDCPETSYVTFSGNSRGITDSFDLDFDDVTCPASDDMPSQAPAATPTAVASASVVPTATACADGPIGQTFTAPFDVSGLACVTVTSCLFQKFNAEAITASLPGPVSVVKTQFYKIAVPAAHPWTTAGAIFAKCGGLLIQAVCGDSCSGGSGQVLYAQGPEVPEVTLLMLYRCCPPNVETGSYNVFLAGTAEKPVRPIVTLCNFSQVKTVNSGFVLGVQHGTQDGFNVSQINVVDGAGDEAIVLWAADAHLFMVDSNFRSLICSDAVFWFQMETQKGTLDNCHFDAIDGDRYFTWLGSGAIEVFNCWFSGGWQGNITYLASSNNHIRTSATMLPLRVSVTNCPVIAPEPEPDGPKSKKAIYIGLGIAGGALIIIVIVVAFVWNRKRSPSAAKDSPLLREY